MKGKHSKSSELSQTNRLVAGMIWLLLGIDLQASETVPAEAEKANLVAGNDEHVMSLNSRIQGDQAQPRVLYLLPWQRPQNPAIDAGELDRSVRGVFDHIEPRALQLTPVSSRARSSE